MSDILLCPSMMCSDYGNLAQETRKLDEAGIDIFHCDVMDGAFVPNMTMGLMDIKAIRQNSSKPIDCHLMIENPETKVDWFIEAGANIIYLHPESARYCGKTLQYIRSKGVASGIAINPDTSFEAITELLHYCDYVLVMSVNPGFAGQSYISYVNEKIQKLVDCKEKYNYKIVLDGVCSPERIKDLHPKGVDGFVLGTSALFNKGKEYQEICRELREL